MLDRQLVFQMLRDLRDPYASFTHFGARVHHYKLGRTLTDAEVRRVEAEYDFSLPIDYHHFLRTIGNGGAGPSYGLYPLGFQHRTRSLESWDKVGMIGHPGRPFPHRDAWNLPIWYIAAVLVA